MIFNIFPNDFVNVDAQTINLPPAKTWVQDPALNKLQKPLYKLYDNPTNRKIVKVAAYILGAGLIVTAFISPPVITAIGLASAGAVIIGITYLASRFFDCLISMRHDMKNHAFQPQKFEKNGVLLAELYYNNDVPILKFETSDPYESGFAYGHLLGDKIVEIRHNIDFCLHTLSRFTRPSKLNNVLSSIKSKIPPNYLKELEGVVDGYNTKKSIFDPKLTLNDLVYLQLMSDMNNFTPKKMLELENGKKDPISLQPMQIQVAACSLTATFDNNQIPLMARTMDWQSFGILGATSLIVSRINSNSGIRTAEVSVPGLLGTVTGVNNHGLTVAMNVAPYESGIDSIDGIPSAYYNRLILENSTSFESAERFVNGNNPLCPYHLTVSDKNSAGTFSMYQGQDYQDQWALDKHNGHLLNRLTVDQPLITTNCACNQNGGDIASGKTRKEALDVYMQVTQQINDRKYVLKQSQVIPLVNNNLSTHRVIMGSNTLEVAFDNAWAGDRELQSVDLTKIFA